MEHTDVYTFFYTHIFNLKLHHIIIDPDIATPSLPNITDVFVWAIQYSFYQGRAHFDSFEAPTVPG